MAGGDAGGAQAEPAHLGHNDVRTCRDGAGDGSNTSICLRNLQDEKPEGHYGFITFIPWPFMDRGTRLAEKDGIRSSVTAAEYLRLIALSRLVLDNIPNIQSSILTVGRETAMISLHGGANDLGSVMIEENVVSAAGDPFRVGPGDDETDNQGCGIYPRKKGPALYAGGETGQE